MYTWSLSFLKKTVLKVALKKLFFLYEVHFKIITNIVQLYINPYNFKNVVKKMSYDEVRCPVRCVYLPLRVPRWNVRNQPNYHCSFWFCTGIACVFKNRDSLQFSIKFSVELEIYDL